MTLPALMKQVERGRKALAALAPRLRETPAAFAQYVLRHSKTGARIKLAPIHKAWHQLANDHKRLVIWSHTEAGKTEQMAIARTLWEIGRDPNLSVCILSNTYDQAVKIARPIARYVESSDALHEVFPELTPGDLWTSSAFNVKRRVNSKDPTIQVKGIHGNILGARIDRLIIDDILDRENTRTVEARNQLWDWLSGVILSRLTANARVIVIGTAWHPGVNGVGADALYRFAALPSWEARRYPVLDDDPKSPTFNQPRWPEVWPVERIEFEKTQRGSLEFARTMMCVAHDDASAVFKKAWVDKALEAGKGREFRYSLPGAAMPGSPTFTGVDLAVQQHSAADLTVLTTIMVHPGGKKEVIWIESGRWAGPDIVERIKDHYRRYNSTIMVENNAAQDYIRQYVAAAGVPVKGYTTGRNKAHPDFGVNHLATEMETNQWMFPNKDGVPPRELDSLITEMYQYDPKAHTGDRLMSLFFAREAYRLSNIRGEVGYLNLLSR
jgi:hypothetical protein